MQCQLLRPDSPLWLECLSAARHDFYHAPQYVELNAFAEEGQPWAFFAESGGNRFFVPLIFRSVKLAEAAGSKHVDAFSPYGYPCPLAFKSRGGDPDAGFLDEALQSMVSALRERGIISAFLRLHPLLPLPTAPFQNHGCLVQHGQTVFIDLTLPHEVLWQQTSSSTRNRINTAKRKHCVVDMDRTSENLDAFVELYYENMHRVGATNQYFFSRDYFARLLEGMKDYLHLCLVRVEGAVAGGGIFSESCGIVQYHLSGTKEEYLNFHSSKFMLDFIRTWAKERGNRELHLGGGLGAAEDSLFCFKASFSPLRRPFYTWRLIVDPAAYNAEVDQWEHLTETTADALDGFFPAYRKPFGVTLQS